MTTYEALANPIGQGIVYMVKHCHCNSLIKNIFQELEEMDMSEDDAKRIAIFLEAMSSTDSSLLVAVLDYVKDQHDNEVNIKITLNSIHRGKSR